MQRSYHIHAFLALFAFCAIAWMSTQSQSTTTAYAQLPPTPTPSDGPPLPPDGSHLCVGSATISGTVVDTDGNPIVGAVILLDEVQLPYLGREAVTCSGYQTNESGEFVVTELSASEWMLSVQPPTDNETLFATQDIHLVIEDGATIEIDEPFILTDMQVTAATTLQDGTTPSFSQYHLYEPHDFNGNGEVACYLSTTDPNRPFYQAFSILAGSTTLNRIAFQEYTEADGLIRLGSLPNGDYCLRVQPIDANADEPGAVFISVMEREFSITTSTDTVDLGTLVPDSTPKRLTIQTITEDGEPAADVLFSVYKAAPPAGGAYGRTDEAGLLSFDVVGGTWQIQKQEVEGILLEEGNLQSIVQEVTFAEDDSVESQTLSIVVDAEDSSPVTAMIRGTVRKPDGSPAIGAEGTVSLSSGNAGADDWQWQSALIDPETATFEANVIPGTWRLTYSLHVYSADDEYASYKPIGEAISVSVEDDQTVTHDMTLIRFDSTVRGSVLRPDGTAVEAGRVWIRDNGFTRRPVDIVDGIFETELLSGIEYKIEVDDASGYFAANKLGLPALYRLTTAPNSTTEIALQTQTLDASIVGTVYRKELADHGSDFIVTELKAVQNAEVYATAPDGQCIHAVTDENGAYMLDVPSGTTWYVSAYWWDETEGKFYETSDKTKILIADAQAYEMDLTVEVVQYELPPELDETFDAAEAWNGTLNDGTTIEIPAGAILVDNLDGDDVQIVVKPLMLDLPRSYEVEVVRYGFEIHLFNARTGEKLVAPLQQNMTVTYPYLDDTLAAMDADESSIGVSVLNKDGSTWESVSSVTLNESTNTIGISLDQPTAAAVTVQPRRDALDNTTNNGANGEQSEAQRDSSIFLPMLVR